MGFFIQRPAQPGQVLARNRYLTPGCGWTYDLRKAKQFATHIDANARNGTRDLVINIRACRRCNCTEYDACLIKGRPCCWVEADLCDACLTPVELKRWRAGDKKPSGGIR